MDLRACLLSLGVVVAGCHLLGGQFELADGTGAGVGNGGFASVTGPGSGAGTGSTCVDFTDCLDPEIPACQVPECMNGTCTTSKLGPPETCFGLKFCNSEGTCVDCLDADDCPETACEAPVCNAGVCELTPEPNTKQCGNNSTCDGQGNCNFCQSNADCMGGGQCIVATGECVEPGCNDGIKNQNETGVDCGGVCGGGCPDGEGCGGDHDCQSGHCHPTGTCVPCLNHAHCGAGAFCSYDDNPPECHPQQDGGDCSGYYAYECVSGCCGLTIEGWICVDASNCQ